ncbi:MAG TPA: hypothetical protein DEA44_16680 [Firmicutes bacterium]|nr:hypothetical protein [Bacillota bacterium]
MTADQIFDSVIALMFAESGDKPDYEANYIAQLNMKLEEVFNANNSIRIKKGKAALEEPPFITSLSDDVGYEFELERSLLPLGIAGDLYVDDDETGIANDYRERYRIGIIQKAAARFVDMEGGHGEDIP